MKINSSIHRLTKIVVDILFYGGILAFIFIIPFAKMWRTYYGLGDNEMLFYAAILFLSGICAIYIMWQLKKIFKSISGGDPFIVKNVGCLRKISVACMLISIIYIVKAIWYFSVTAIVLVVAFALMGLICLTLKDIIKQAIAYKEENDWTV